MVIEDTLEAPTGGDLAFSAAYALKLVTGDDAGISEPGLPQKIDGRFSADQWELIQRMRLTPPPPSPSNAHADDAKAAAFGAKLFSDPLLASEAGVSCATCHDPQKGFADDLPTAVGVAIGSLNTPGIALAAHDRWAFWDGRADTLWSQALGPLENAAETGGSRLFVAHRIASQHASDYEAIFGALPPLSDAVRFPAAGKPGDAAFDGMTAEDRDAVTRVFVDVGKAIEAFERTLPPPATRFDAYLDGDLEALTPAERDGLSTFFVAGCASCHHGPTLSDGAFHDILMPASAPDGPGDRGRIDGAAKLLASPFRADGPFSDDPTAGARLAMLVPGEEMLGQMKTPTLRGLASTAPYGHAGTFPDLTSVVQHYSQETPLTGGPGQLDAAMVRFSQGHVEPLVAFLRAVGGAPKP
jgi:cytochrome c peroxidase